MGIRKRWQGIQNNYIYRLLVLRAAPWHPSGFIVSFLIVDRSFGQAAVPGTIDSMYASRAMAAEGPGALRPEGVWTGRARELERTFTEFLWAFLLSIIFMYIILASQYESLVHPFTIMLSLPLAFVGALLALLICGQTLSIMSMMAFIFLLGLVTKNAILLIDYANTLRDRDGLERDAARSSQAIAKPE